MKTKLLTAVFCAAALLTPAAFAAAKKPNIVLIVSDDTGWGDLGPYLGGEARGMQTPNFDRLAAEGMTFTDFYGQPSCTPGRAAIQTGRIPNRSGMTTVAFQGEGGGLPHAEWTLGSVLKQAGYKTYFTGKWHLGEAEYALPNAQGYDEMKNVFLYHLNAYAYTDPERFPDMEPEIRQYLNKVTKGSLSGRAGEKAKEDFKVNARYVDTPEKGVVGIPYLDAYVEKAALGFLEKAARSKEPFFLNVNFMKNHQPNMPHPDFIHKSISKTKYADSVLELDTRVGHVLKKIDELGLADNTIVFYTVDNGAWQDVYPDAGYTPFRGTKGTVREGGNRVPAIVRWPGKIKAGTKTAAIAGGLDLMKTFATVAGIKQLPTKDRDGKPMMFDSYDMTPIWLGTGKPERKVWFYFTENELSPGAVRYGHLKAVTNLRGDDGAQTGGLAVDTNLGWKGAEKYVATMPQMFDLRQDPQERYDIFMTNWTSRDWMSLPLNNVLKKLMQTYVEYPPRPLQSESYDGPITITGYQNFEHIREKLKKQGVLIGMPTGN